jgi:hypothetical protein
MHDWQKWMQVEDYRAHFSEKIKFLPDMKVYCRVSGADCGQWPLCLKELEQ